LNRGSAPRRGRFRRQRQREHAPREREVRRQCERDDLAVHLLESGKDLHREANERDRPNHDRERSGQSHCTGPRDG
jgi:hypothetical protein